MLHQALEARFVELEVRIEELVALLGRADEHFWRRMFVRCLPEIRARRLTGVTAVLGYFGGEDTFSDLSVGTELDARRLSKLRTAIFDVANGIAADCAGPRS